jgi:hypothetical protein
MTPERWEQICQVLEKALELPPDERSPFLNRACASNPELRREVETLLASSDDVRSSFLQALPPPATLASPLSSNLTSASRPAAFGIREPIETGTKDRISAPSGSQH